MTAMRIKPLLACVVAMLLLGALVRARPARLLSARVTALSAGEVPLASVALAYSPGTRPVSVIIDVEGQQSTGSATIDGEQLFVTIPLIGRARDGYHIRATVAHRMLGRVRINTQEFR